MHVCTHYTWYVGFEDRVGYLLLVLSSDGVLTEHYLQPFKAPSANEGDDAAIGLDHSMKRCWKFLRYTKEHISHTVLFKVYLIQQSQASHE